MAQHDYTIANQTFPNTRADLNNVFAAIVSQNSGATAPSTTYAYQLWYDTTTDILKMRNANDDAWVELFTIDQVADTASAAGVGAISGSNLIINGAMTVSQRNGTSAIAPTGYNNFIVDRFSATNSDPSNKMSFQQVTDAPDGFYNSIKATTTTAVPSLGATERYFITTVLEGNTVTNTDWGKSSGKTCTISFWAKSSLTGNFPFSINPPAGTPCYNTTYNISAANTWEHKTITVVAPTTGTWNLGTNSGSITLVWGLGTGSTYSTSTTNTWQNTFYEFVDGAVAVVSTLNATLQITGVQLEVGTATPFEHRSYGDELARCQRYYYESGGTAVNDWGQKGYQLANNYVANTLSHPVAMRAAPTLTKAGTFVVSNIAQPAALGSSTTSWQWQAQKNGSNGAWTMYSNSSGKFTLQSEL